MINRSAAQIEKLLKLSRELMTLAEEGLAFCNDDGCLLLNSLVRDSAYRIHKAAEKEKEIHRDKGTWDSSPSDRAGL